jgi:hypothetical protein
MEKIWPSKTGDQDEKSNQPSHEQPEAENARITKVMACAPPKI